jgi:hypothetical protein
MRINNDKATSKSFIEFEKPCRTDVQVKIILNQKTPNNFNNGKIDYTPPLNKYHLRPSSEYRNKSINLSYKRDGNKSAIFYDFPDNEIEKRVDMGYCRDLHEKLLKEQQDKIKQKIEERENRSKVACEKALKLKNYEKDDLIKKNEADIFFLHRDRRDPILEKAKQRNVSNENRILGMAKHIKNEKPEVTSYYKKCVE